MRGGRAGPLLGRELYAENADRDLGIAKRSETSRGRHWRLVNK